MTEGTVASAKPVIIQFCPSTNVDEEMPYGQGERILLGPLVPVSGRRSAVRSDLDPGPVCCCELALLFAHKLPSV